MAFWIQFTEADGAFNPDFCSTRMTFHILYHSDSALLQHEAFVTKTGTQSFTLQQNFISRQSV